MPSFHFRMAQKSHNVAFPAAQTSILSLHPFHEHQGWLRSQTIFELRRPEAACHTRAFGLPTVQLDLDPSLHLFSEN